MPDDTLPPIALYNTLTRRVEPLVPREPGKVAVYCCGPTTYDVAHVGHARAAPVPDLLVRVLRHRGFDVTYVRNITDIDDKILARAQERGEVPTDLAARMADAYRDDMAAVGCLVPTHEPRVSGHLPQIIAADSLFHPKFAHDLARLSGLTTGGIALRTFGGFCRHDHEGVTTTPAPRAHRSTF